MKNLIKKTAATTLSVLGILSMMPSALCAPGGEDQKAQDSKRISGKGHVDCYYAMTVEKYFDSVGDLSSSLAETYRFNKYEENFVSTFPNDNVKKLIYLPDSFCGYRFKEVLKENQVVDENMKCIGNWKRKFELYSEDPMYGCRIKFTNGEKTIIFMFDPCADGVLSSPDYYNYMLSECGVDENEELPLAAITSSGEFSIPDYVTRIENGAFENWDDLTSISIPSSVKSIGKNAFKDCTNLTKIDIPDSVTSIEEGAFSGCDALTSINIPNSVTSIGNYAFFDCKNLKNVSIPESVTSIGEAAFCGCENLTNINVPVSVKLIGLMTFFGCKSLSHLEFNGKIYNADTYNNFLQAIDDYIESHK